MSDEKQADKDRAALIKTITKMEAMTPILGGKWRENSLKYYYRRLSELVLRQTLGGDPTDEAVDAFLPEVRKLIKVTQDVAP